MRELLFMWGHTHTCFCETLSKVLMPFAFLSWKLTVFSCRAWFTWETINLSLKNQAAVLLKVDLAFVRISLFFPFFFIVLLVIADSNICKMKGDFCLSGSSNTACSVMLLLSPSLWIPLLTWARFDAKGHRCFVPLDCPFIQSTQRPWLGLLQEGDWDSPQSLSALLLSKLL